MRAFRRVMVSLCFGVIGIGLLLIIIGAVNGGAENNRWRKEYMGETSNYNAVYSGVESIEMNISWGMVNIKPGNEFSIDCANIYDDLFKSEVTDGVWKINYNTRGQKGRFMFSLSHLRIGFLDDSGMDSVITVTVPEEYLLDHFNMILGAGKASADSIRADKVSFEVGAGQLILDRIEAKESAAMEAGAGEIIATNMNTSDIKLNCGAGRIEMNGRVEEGGKVNCGVGEIVMNLHGSKEEYGYKVNCGIGSVEINNERYSGSSSVKYNQGASRVFDLDCGIGKIALTINEFRQ